MYHIHLNKEIRNLIIKINKKTNMISEKVSIDSQ